MRCASLLDYPKYIIFEDGTLLSTSTKKVFIRPSISTDGYHQVNVMSTKAINGYRHSVKVHRLVALAFIENAHNHKEVNHKDGNKLNNHYSNLEWCDRSHNIKHCYSLGFRSSKGHRNGNYKTGKYVSV